MENDTYDRLPLPCDNAESFRYYPEINTYKIASGDYRATVTGYDADVKRGGHVSGGTLTLLWKYGRGPMIAASVADYVLVEPQNMQLTRDSNHRALVPRLVCNIDGVIYSTAYFTSPRLSSEQKNGEITVNAVSGLCDSTLLRMREDVDRLCSYTLSPEGMRISISSVGDARMILPLIDGTICLMCGTIESKKGIFFLTGGFEATEYIIAPDKNGRIELILK